MPPRLSPAPRVGAFYPTSDPQTYRDLLLFEERLKSNASSLNRRKRRYQLFLAQLLCIIAFLLSEVLLQTNFLSVPYVHRFLKLGLLCVAVTTLALFFLSGMYSEKIAYANKYVPHANRALRNLNMYLNVRQPPLRSKLPFNPFSMLFGRTSPAPTPTPSPTSPTPTPTDSGSGNKRRSPSRDGRLTKRSSSVVPLSPIPPSSNPRGELIFSSRVDRQFRDSYDRYRTAFERRREERERAAHERTWLGWLMVRVLSVKAPVPPPVPTPAASSGTATPVGPGRTASLAGSARGRSSPGGTPSSSRRSSPVPRRTRRSEVIAASSLSAASPVASTDSGMMSE